MDTSQISVEHVRLLTSKPFQEVINALNLHLGTFDFQVQVELSQNRDLNAAKAKYEPGTSGLMKFAVYDHGSYLEESDPPQKAMQYVIGNPFIARRMTQYDIRAALYAPLRILIYENNENKTCIEYDQPSSLFGQFENAAVTQVAVELDKQLKCLLDKAMG